ncbi:MULTISPECIES: type II toxin-antitoxin system HicB family antitoxin [unclassified Serratia (in: enterobacteria)]|uniref:type II toxin-antitoxin system HicB family antitoxin n=1 Tax=unclassified Serratia (in: enterobacteria) TaxID=2647522 RepID=UPI000502963B|nr:MULTISPECIES: type II toxin-antitoxin system HicB family antitoxin [unclassified Serratia (in: enterobacteria)]KFK91798.1 antitoxin [Serratia sp. Ag2]KFK93976.1 antitoxin [Serratia sp. Ag1]
MRYPVNLSKAEEGGFFVEFPDIPEALTQGKTREEALENARDALVTAFEFYFEDGDRIPEPGIVTGDYVELPLSIEAIESRMSQTELAEKMNVKKQEVTRLFDLKHSTKIDTIQKAVNSLGHRMEFKYV